MFDGAIAGSSPNARLSCTADGVHETGCTAQAQNSPLTYDSRIFKNCAGLQLIQLSSPVRTDSSLFKLTDFQSATLSLNSPIESYASDPNPGFVTATSL